MLLLGLLAYDVFWVFGSPSVIGENVMLTVATSGNLRALVGPPRTKPGWQEVAKGVYVLASYIS